MDVKIDRKSDVEVEITITVPAADVQKQIDAKLLEYRKTIDVKGFRKGKAPRSVLRSRFERHVKSEIIEKLVGPAFEKAVQDADLEILRPMNSESMNPPVEELSVKDNEPLIFEVSVDVKPAIAIPDLAQLEVDKGEVNVPKEDVDNFLQNLREDKANYAPIEDRPAQEGDSVTISIGATSDGDTMEDQDEVLVEIGENMPIPEFAEHLVGMEPGDEREFSVDFPPEHQNERLAGKKIEFRIKLQKISEKSLPLMDDDFAKDLGQDDLQHLTANVWNQLVESQKLQRRAEQRNDLVKQLLEKSEFEVPDFLVQTRAEAHVRIDTQWKKLGEDEVSEEEFSEYEASALGEIRTMWVFEEIAKREEVKVTDEEIETKVNELAQRLDKDPQKYRKLLEDTNRIGGISASIWEDKIVDLLIEKASPKRALIV